MYTSLSAARAFLYAVAHSCDRSVASRKDAAAALLFAAESSTSVTMQTVQCLGGNGYTADYPAGRLLRDSKLYEIGAGTTEIRRIVIGRELIDEAKRRRRPRRQA
jgi:isovaleryl-CoA dehydrogenase